MSNHNDRPHRFGYTGLAGTEDYTNVDWAWEFLRENASFVDAWEEARDCFNTEQKAAGVTVIRERKPSPLLEFGIRYCSSPAVEAGQAVVMWIPEWCPKVARMYAICNCRPLSHRATFDLRATNCNTINLIAEDGVQHVIFQQGNRSLQLKVCGAPLIEPVYLFAEAVGMDGNEQNYLWATRCFEHLRSTGRLPLEAFTPYARWLRMSEMLQAYRLNKLYRLNRPHDGSIIHSVAVGLYGRERVRQLQLNPHSGLRDHIRNTIEVAEKFVAWKYRELLL
jgi:hypothetical protein